MALRVCAYVRMHLHALLCARKLQPDARPNSVISIFSRSCATSFHRALLTSTYMRSYFTNNPPTRLMQTPLKCTNKSRVYFQARSSTPFLTLQYSSLNMLLISLHFRHSCCIFAKLRNKRNSSVKYCSFRRTAPN